MRTILVCTVGTGLKTNLEKEPGCAELLKQGNTKGLILRIESLDPEDRLLGAEINSVASIVQKGKLTRCGKLLLLVSDTEDGRFIGKILKDYFERSGSGLRFEDVEIKAIQGLTDASPHQFRTEGLRNLVKAIAGIVRRYGSDSILINATGGYKAQISFAGMIGQALEIPVCYLFERFSEVIELPPQPISMDMSFWLENVDAFFDLAEDSGEKDLQARDERFATLVEKIEVDGDMIVGLSAVGQLFHETFKYRFDQQRQRLLPPDSGLAPEKKVVRYEDGNKGRHQGLSSWLEKLREFPYVKSIYTHYYNPGLPSRNYFRGSKTGEVSQLEGGYSNGKATTKCDIITTAQTRSQRDAALADLREILGKMME